jgi:hypothetical protein
MSKEPTKKQQEFAANTYQAVCRFLHENIEAICTDPVQRSCSVQAISDVLASFSMLHYITDEQHKFLVTALNDCLGYEITKFNEKE